MDDTFNLKEGDRVRLKNDHKAIGSIDEIWQSDDVQSGVPMASVVWDVSGCIGEGPLSDLEKV